MIDKIPAVGRIVLRDSIFRGGFCAKAGKIVKVTKAGCSYSDGRYGVTSLRNIAAVCDTEAEEEALLAFDKRCMKECEQLGNSATRSALSSPSSSRTRNEGAQLLPRHRSPDLRPQAHAAPLVGCVLEALLMDPTFVLVLALIVFITVGALCCYLAGLLSGKYRPLRKLPKLSRK